MGLLPYNQNNTVCRTQFFAPCQYYTGIHTFARFSPCIMLDVVISSMMVWRILSSSKPPSISRHNAHTRLPAEAWKYMNQGKEWLWCSICFQLPMISLGLIEIVLMFTPFEFEAVQDRCVNNCCLSINALHTCVYIYIWQLSSFRAPKLWFIDLSHYLPYSIHFSEFMPIYFTRKQTKHENTQSPPFSWLLTVTVSVQNINTERASIIYM